MNQHTQLMAGADAELDARIFRQGRAVVWGGFALLLAFLIWAWWAELDEVSTGSGTVVPSSREQVIQSLEGGILRELHVREGDLVESGQVLARLDPTLTESDLDETAARYRAALASAARLEAEVNDTALIFPPELEPYPQLRAAEQALYQTRRSALQRAVSGIEETLSLISRELQITESLAGIGASSEVETLRLRRQRADLMLRRTELENEYQVQAREALAHANADIQALGSAMRGRQDSVARTTLRSPVRGIINDISVTTIGGIVAPNGRLMEIVPLDDQLLVEARITPRDIAFIYPGQRAQVKITAYDYAVYGALEGEVATISADTIQDEVHADTFYYRVFIRTEADALYNARADRFPITPGMIAVVDISTGSKTVLDYLLKPLNRAREALRER